MAIAVRWNGSRWTPTPWCSGALTNPCACCARASTSPVWPRKPRASAPARRHPEGYLEALANLYRDFADAIRRGERGAAKGVPGMAEGLRGMAFIDALLRSQASTAKWTSLDNASRRDDTETAT